MTRYLALFFIALLLGAAGNAQADTTWVPTGDINGTWTVDGSPYMIAAGHVTVPTGQTLTISAGVTIYFTGPYKFVVNGLLAALGQAGDPIYFTTDTLVNTGGWRGLRIESASDSTLLRHCVIEHSRALGSGADRYGGGIECLDTSPTLENCVLRYNRARLNGGGIYCATGAAPVLRNCVIEHNSSEFGAGAGLACYMANPVFTDCSIRYNDSPIEGGGMFIRTNSNPVFERCTISYNTASRGGAAFVRFSTCQPQFICCTFAWNTAAQVGGAIFDHSARTRVSNSVFHHNSAVLQGGGLASDSAALTTVEHCTFFANGSASGGGVYVGLANPTLRNSIIAFSGGEGIVFTSGHGATVTACDLFGNTGGHFQGEAPAGFSVLDSTNLSGTACDRYRNVFVNPAFVDTSESDLHLQTGSLCISASYRSQTPIDRESGARPQPAHTLADLGAYESAQGGGYQYAYGTLTGTVGPGTVFVDDNVAVPTDSHLVVLPGTEFRATGWYWIRVYGRLTALGTAQDSIIFTRHGADTSADWKGLQFISTRDSNRLAYAVIEYVHGEGIVTDSSRGALYCSRANLNISHSLIRGGRSIFRGGGASIRDSSNVNFDFCVIRDNWVNPGTTGFGGGVYAARGSHVTLRNCELLGNSAGVGGGVYAASTGTMTTTLTVISSRFEDNDCSGRGGGLYADCAGLVDSCVVTHNRAASGGGVAAKGSITFRHCVISHNAAAQQGGGVYAEAGPRFERCTIFADSAGQGGGAAFCECFGTPPVLTSSIVRNSDGAGIYFQRCGGMGLRYTDVSGGSGEPLDWATGASDGPANIGVLSGINAAGDSCDMYQNIYIPPLFVNEAGDDLHLLAASPCINTGDPQLAQDPDGTIADMGAFSYAQPYSVPTPFSLLSPASNDTADNPWATPFVWQSSYDADAADEVTYTVHFYADGNTVTRNAGLDTTLTVDLTLLGIPPESAIEWWVTAHSQHPDTTISSREHFMLHLPFFAADDAGPVLPAEFALAPAYPNPFNPRTLLRIALPRAANVELVIYDVQGRLVRRLLEGRLSAGWHGVPFEADGLPSGTYFAALRASSFHATQKIVLLK